MAAIRWALLKEPFPPDAIEWRIGRSGVSRGKVWATCLAYVTARAIQDRLDDVFGVGGWKNEYSAGPAGGVLCRIWFRSEDGEWVWREDGSGEMEATRGLSESDASKGTYSAALKRAGSALGIGRYLYRLPEGFAVITENGRFRGEAKGDGNERIRFKWNPPDLPAWALPKGQADTERLKDRLREVAVEVDTERGRTGEMVEERPAAGLVEEWLAAHDRTAPEIRKYGNALGAERLRLKALPDASAAPTYDTFEAPALEDASNELPFE